MTHPPTPATTPLPNGRTTQIGEGTFAHECGYASDDGWAAVKVEWSKDAIGEDQGAWVATISVQSGAIGIGATQMEAMIELVRSLAAFVDVMSRREAELHRTISVSPDALAQEIARAGSDLHRVQHIICNEMPDVERSDDETDPVSRALRPLWRAERALEAFAARLSALPVPPVARSGEVAIAPDVSWREALRTWRSFWHTPYSDALALTGSQADALCDALAIPFDAEWTDAELERVWRETKSQLNPAAFLRACLRALGTVPPTQAVDDIGVDDGATDGYAVSVARAVPEDVAAALDECLVSYVGTSRGSVEDSVVYRRARTRLLALYRPAGPERCACGHSHACGDEGEDIGCSTCACNTFRPAAPAGETRAENLLLGLHKIVSDLAPYFDKPLTDEAMPRWLALDSAQKAVAQYFAALPPSHAGEPE